MRAIEVTELPDKSAEALYWKFLHDKSLPTGRDLEEICANPTIIPAELRSFDLVFPRAVSPGLSEGGCKVTDPSIGMLTWNGVKWEQTCLLAGKDGWGRSGPDYCSPHARLVRFKS